MEPKGTLVTGRCVFVVEDPWPAGLITGYEDAGGFVVEAVVAFHTGALLPMLAESKQIARTRGYEHVRFRLPKSFPKTPKLARLARHVGCQVYHEDDDYMDFVWRP